MSNAGPRFVTGDSFVLLGKNAHLWIVLSDTSRDPRNLLIVNVTTFRPRDGNNCCILLPGEHPFIQHKSRVYFEDARMATATHLTSLEARGKLDMKGRLSDSIYLRIYNAAVVSDDIFSDGAELLIAQGIRHPY